MNGGHQPPQEPPARRRRRVARPPDVAHHVRHGEEVHHRREEDADDVLGGDRPRAPSDGRLRAAPSSQKRNAIAVAMNRTSRNGCDSRAPRASIRREVTVGRRHRQIERADDTQAEDRDLRSEQHVDQLRARSSPKRTHACNQHAAGRDQLSSGLSSRAVRSRTAAWGSGTRGAARGRATARAAAPRSP